MNVSMDILDTFVQLLGALFVCLMMYLAPKIAGYIKVDGEAIATEELLSLILSFVQAADQLLKEDDPTGEKRMQYVIDHLAELGYEITDAVISLIEGAVWEVNLYNEIPAPDETGDLL